MNTATNTATNTRTSASATTPRRLFHRIGAASAGLALIATGAFGASTLASEGDGGGGSDGPPGLPVGADELMASSGDLTLMSEPLIQTNGSTYDDTILTKYIPANAFQVRQGEGDREDLIRDTSTTCLEPSPGSGGAFTIMLAPVELPDGARIKQIGFYGEDDDAGQNAAINLFRTEFNSSLAIFPNPPTISKSTTLVDGFSTADAPGDTNVFGADDLEEVTGSPFTNLAAGFSNRFHTVEVRLPNADPATTALCGVRVSYQIPTVADAGVVFHPIDPVRAFDSRRATFAESGLLTPGASKVISVADGYDSDGVAIPAQVDAIPANATAVAYNITVAGATGPNFVAVTAGDATEFVASSINYVNGSNIANAGTVTIADDRTIKLWGGDNTGSAHTLIDITGYYAPATLPNMGN